MVISKPKEYISILISDMKLTIQNAMHNYYEETFHGLCPAYESKSKLDLEMSKVDKLRDEIILICENIKNNEE